MHNSTVYSNIANNLALPWNNVPLAWDPFSIYRARYIEQSKLLNCNETTQYTNFLSIMGGNLEFVVQQHKVETLILGVSGDLDSSFNLLSLAKVIKEKELPCRIVAYHFKNSFQPKRAKRIEKLLKYISENLTPVTFFTYDISFSSKLLSHEIRIFENKKIRPKTHEQICDFNAVMEELISEGMSNTPKREQAPLMHELSVSIRGKLLRSFPASLLVGSTNASEICMSNFTTSDVLVGYAPLAFLQKTQIASMFRQAISESFGCISLTDWEYSLTYSTPFYPSKLRYCCVDKESVCFTRDSKHFEFLNKVTLNKKKSGLMEDFWSSFAKNTESFPVPGLVQYFSDRYIHEFLVNGFSQSKVDCLIQRLPKYESDILLSSFIFLTARELTVKDMYVAKMLV